MKEDNEARQIKINIEVVTDKEQEKQRKKNFIPTGYLVLCFIASIIIILIGNGMDTDAVYNIGVFLFCSCTTVFFWRFGKFLNREN